MSSFLLVFFGAAVASAQGKGERFQVQLALQTHAYLQRLSEKGTHGHKPTDVARTLIEEGIRTAIEKGFITRDDVAAVSSPKKSP